MKFQNKYPDCNKGDHFEFEYSFVFKSNKIGSCGKCGAITTWKNVGMDEYVCSEECCGELWHNKKNDPNFVSNIKKMEDYRMFSEIDLKIGFNAKPATKDILIVVHNQLEYFKICMESVLQNTENYHVYIWDNASNEETRAYLEELKKLPKITVVTSEKNVGFIIPNNELATMGHGEYIICLNSDTKVYPNWDRCMTGFLEKHFDVAQVGYIGGHLDSEGRGFGGSSGWIIDYVPGWCFCIDRDTYNRYGLFNKNFKFAYFEDADLSLRLRKAGKRIYALHVPLVYHYQNKTIETVHSEGKIDVEASFTHNHEQFKALWGDYIKNHRVMKDKMASSKVL